MEGKRWKPWLLSSDFLPHIFLPKGLAVCSQSPTKAAEPARIDRVAPIGARKCQSGARSWGQDDAIPEKLERTKCPTLGQVGLPQIQKDRRWSDFCLSRVDAVES